ncbi:MAG: hotdog fold thioesterase [Bacteroidetes bacterium]|nr:hotdog fold thioesterase [Bacteroidota bacterium]
MEAADIVNKMMHSDYFSQWLGITVEHVEPGSCKLKMRIRKEMLNGFGIAHGAISYAIADSALAFASNGHGRQALSVDTSINHIEPLREGDNLEAIAIEESLKNRFALYRIELRSGSKLVALFKGTVYRSDKVWE